MTVGAVGAVGSGVTPIYAALSPYLNGVVRTSDAVAAAQAQAQANALSAAATAAAATARAVAAADAPAPAPFLNPAIIDIANQTVLDQSVPLINPNTVPPPAQSPTDSVAYGDSGLLIQSYGAVALLTGPVALAAVYGLPNAPAVPPVAPVVATPRIAAIDTAA